MNQKLARYQIRSPRFTLNTEDNSLIRVAGPQQTPWEEDTMIQDISLTGLSFTAPTDLCPQAGEFIKIQFQPIETKDEPNTMACHALVTRVQQVSLSRKLVGVHFYKLEMGHRVSLAKKLQERLTRHVESHNIDFNQDPLFLVIYFIRLSIYFTLSSLLLIYILSHPISHMKIHFEKILNLFF